MDGHLAAVELLNPSGVDVETDDVIACVGQTRA